MTNFILQGANLAGAMIGMIVIAKFGRRTLMGTFQLLQGIALITFGVLYLNTWLDGYKVTVKDSQEFM